MNLLPSSEYSRQQYELVKGSRNVLFDYCRTISPNHFVDQNTSFGRGGSMRNLLVHIANTYQYWIAETSLKKDIVFTEYESKKDISEVIDLFESIDDFMIAFFEFMERYEGSITFEINGMQNSATALELFSHVITHEFHHKGQILSLSRHLGYLPVDTDIMR